MIQKNPYAAYNNSKIQTATPAELTLLLYEGAIKFTNIAIVAMEKNDVQKAHDNIMKTENIIEEFQARGINNLVVTAHVEGDLVKFYGVAGTGFFHTCYPTDGNFSKFGDEHLNGKALHTAFNLNCLHHDASKLAGLTGIMVYGGDCIVRPDGSYAIIDFNDWPSFSCCRNEATLAIAQLIEKMTK